VKKGKKPFLDRRRQQRVEEERRHLILEEEHAYHSVQTNINKGKFKVEDRDYHWKSAFQDFVNDLSDPAQQARAQAELDGIAEYKEGVRKGILKTNLEGTEVHHIIPQELCKRLGIPEEIMNSKRNVIVLPTDTRYGSMRRSIHRTSHNEYTLNVESFINAGDTCFEVMDGMRELLRNGEVSLHGPIRFHPASRLRNYQDHATYYFASDGSMRVIPPAATK